ncbi:hypothetical protein [Humibacter ginsenosidimutans]|nr:hypothetical protein [Humibacter ginsenosidimutans]
MRRILILGSTGSIGTQALEIRANPDRGSKWPVWPPESGG